MYIHMLLAWADLYNIVRVGGDEENQADRIVSSDQEPSFAEIVSNTLETG
jgi:hypothetical protein